MGPGENAMKLAHSLVGPAALGGPAASTGAADWHSNLALTSLQTLCRPALSVAIWGRCWNVPGYGYYGGCHGPRYDGGYGYGWRRGWRS
jgi:hypothetical protein